MKHEKTAKRKNNLAKIEIAPCTWNCNEETAINILYTAKIINEFVQKM